MQVSRWTGALAAALGAVPAAGMVSQGPAQAEPYRFHEDHVLGTSLDIVAVAPGPGSAALAVAAIRTEIRRLDGVLSGHRPDSALARLNAGETAGPLPPDLFAVLAAAEAMRRETGGAFSGRLGAAVGAWSDRAAGRPAAYPAHVAAEAEAAEVTLDAARLAVGRPDGVTFALDGIAKGYVIDRAVDAARRAVPDLAGLLVDIGGDVRCWGCGPGGDGWRVGVAAGRSADNASPPRVLHLDGGAVATSGRGARDLLVGVTARSHLLSSATGAPARGTAAATVVAETASRADALSTAFAIMPPRQAIAMADAMPGVEALVVSDDGRSFASRGWAGLEGPAGTPTAAPEGSPLRLAQAGGAGWPSGFAARVAYEVPNLPSDNYKAPYLTIWITDEKRQLVRTLLVLGREPKWIDSNYVWWRRWGRKDTARVDAVSRPTRMPGRYDAVWDGRDDAGQPVPQGRYLVHAEASREHGGHTYAFGEIDLGAGAAELSLPAKDELGPVRMRYGPGA